MSRLYVGNLAFHTTEDSLREAFSTVGEVTEIHLVLDRMTGSSRGFAFITMGSPEAAKAAIAQLNGHEIDGRALRVDEAQERAPRGGGGGGGGFGGGGGGGRGGGGHGGGGGGYGGGGGGDGGGGGYGGGGGGRGGGGGGRGGGGGGRGGGRGR